MDDRAGSTAPRHAAAVMLVVATVFWGLSFPVSKGLGLLHERLLPGAGTLFSTALVLASRFLIATLVLAVLSPGVVRSLSRSEVWQGAGLGLFGALGMLFQMDGLNHTSASTSAFLTQGYCIILPFVEAGLRKQWPSWITLAGCALFMAGIGLLAGFDWREVRLGRGEVQTLIGSGIFTAQILWLSRPSFAANRVAGFSSVMFLVIGVSCAAAAMVLRPSGDSVGKLLVSGRGAVLTGVLTVLCTLVAFTMMNRWQKGVTATEAGLLYGFEPVFASFFALFLPGMISRFADVNYPDEVVNSKLLAGGLCILGANALVHLGPALRKGPG